MKNYKIIGIVLIIVMILGMGASCTTQKDTSTIEIATLAGPSGMGMAKLFENDNYNISIYQAPDHISTKILNNEIDIASIPSNLVGVLNIATNGGFKVISVNTTGVLYIIGEKTATIENFDDLDGKKLMATGQGATPEYVINDIIANNTADVTMSYLSEHSTLAAQMIAGTETLAMLPEPFVTKVLLTNTNLEIKLSINDLWQDIYGDDAVLPMTATIVMNDFATNHPELLAEFKTKYEASAEYVSANPTAASALIVTNGIFPDATVAENAIPRCNISYIDGTEMITMLTDYYTLLYNANPQSIGGSIPPNEIYTQ